jgi:pyruvate dehydrogenase E2 component (dihydrolipoyllysine-residue acetyltransferase)
MSTDVIMPQMGESIAEGTIVRWIKNVGDHIDRDEPLFEISTDKVDAEIPSPAAGILSKIIVQAGETVPINTVVAVIGAAAAAAQPPAASAPAAPPAKAEEPKTPPAPAAKAIEPPQPQPQADGSPATSPKTESAPEPPRSAPAPSENRPVQQPSESPGPRSSSPSSVAAGLQTGPKGPTTEDLIKQRSSPLVRKIAKEHNVDISQLRGTGIAGRVTKDDILGYIGQEGRGGQPAYPAPVGTERGEAVPAERGQGAGVRGAIKAASDTVEKMSPMRKRIAEHMVASRRTSAHVHSVFEVNFTRVAQAREKHKSALERAGAKLTYLSFIIKAAIDALRAVPVVNASVDGDSIVFHNEINVGIAVALDWGLIVPVIRHADEKNLLGLSRAVADLANRARAKQLKPEEVQGGTFTITNPGVFGALFGMPIINQPQVAILGVGAVEKRPVVVDDAIAIRPMAYLTLGYDHRIIDGAVADEFMSHLKKTIENWDPDVV